MSRGWTQTPSLHRRCIQKTPLGPHFTTSTFHLQQFSKGHPLAWVVQRSTLSQGCDFTPQGGCTEYFKKSM